MSNFKKNIENKKILIVLVVLLLVISTVQSIFLVKLYRSVNRAKSGDEFTQDFGKDFGLKDDFFKSFDNQTWDPFKEFRSMQERMDRMFDNSYNRFRLSPFFDEDKKDTFLPQTDLLEEDDRYVVKMNIPGADKAEIQVDIEGDILTVKAKTQVAKEGKKGDTFLRMERSMGSIKRSIPLPGPVDSGGLKTEYEDGVFTIILPKQE